MNNVVKRSLSGILFVILMVAGLLVNKYLFGALVLLIMGLSMDEFYRMTMGSRYRKSRLLAILTGFVFFILIFCVTAFGINVKYIGLTFVPLMIVMIGSLYVKDKKDFGMFSDIYTGMLYIAVPLALSNLLVFHQGVFDGTLLLCFFLLIWSCDVGAFCFGITLGQRYGKRLFPSISPKKSWIGFWGGMLLTIVTAVVLQRVGLLRYPLLHTIGLAVVMVIGGVYGDLFESQWKRHYEVKDSGSIIPGHGGMLDRFDSAIFAIPIGAVYLIIFGLL